LFHVNERFFNFSKLKTFLDVFDFIPERLLHLCTVYAANRLSSDAIFNDHFGSLLQIFCRLRHNDMQRGKSLIVCMTGGGNDDNYYSLPLSRRLFLLNINEENAPTHTHTDEIYRVAQ